MSIVNTLSLESNRKIKINFDGGDLSSDAGLLLIKEFVSKLGMDKLFSQSFNTNDSALFRYHTDKENLLQMIYMIIAGYFEDDSSDELTNDPVFKAVLNKDTLASQPTISRFHNRMDEDSLNQFLSINQILRKKVYSVQMPEAIILDLDSTLLNTYGKQEGRAFNFHYQSNGYHPLVCYDGLTGDLIKIQLRDETQYSSTGVVEFLQPILDEYLEGTEMNRSLHEFIDGVDAMAEEFPPTASIAQVHYNVSDVEETGAFLTEAFLFKTTYDYVTRRKNFKVNRDGYSLAINAWEFIPHSHQDFYGVSEIEWRVPNMRELENLVLNLESKKVPFHYYDAVLKVPTANGIQYCFKVGDHA